MERVQVKPLLKVFTIHRTLGQLFSPKTVKNNITNEDVCAEFESNMKENPSIK